MSRGAVEGASVDAPAADASVSADVRLEMRRLPIAADLPLPRYMTAGASGMDVVAALDDEPLVIEPGRIALVPTGLELAVPDGYEVQVRARSGLALRHGILVVNAPGTIDADYRGHVQVILGNFGPEPFTVRRGDRIAQLVVCPVAKATVVLVDALAATDRGAGGFGSTGRGSA